VSRGKPKRDDGPPKVPGYLVSFGDMMTILLTFFILLCTYATQRQHGFVTDGIGSFRMAIEALGLPGFLTSDRQPISIGEDRIRTQTRERDGEPEEDSNRVTDEIERIMSGIVSPLSPDEHVRIALPIRFRPGMDEPLPGQEDLLRHVAGLVSEDGRKVEIIGHADRETLSRADRSRLALRRATRIVTLLQREHGVPSAGLAVGATMRVRGEIPGTVPEGEITLRAYRPGRFVDVGTFEEE
jgi:chemotaxis protein MotB